MKLRGISDGAIKRLAKIADGSDGWLPSLLEEDERALVSNIVTSASSAIRWDIFMAAAIAVELLQDVNEHEGAEAVNNVLSGIVLQKMAE